MNDTDTYAVTETSTEEAPAVEVTDQQSAPADTAATEPAPADDCGTPDTADTEPDDDTADDDEPFPVGAAGFDHLAFAKKVLASVPIRPSHLAELAEIEEGEEGEEPDEDDLTLAVMLSIPHALLAFASAVDRLAGVLAAQAVSQS